MAKSHYELLDVARGATSEEIKHAFRREIAKYHPDKVQHLGKEFQDIAAARAAELTQAYKTLTDTALRAEYDATLELPPVAAPASPPAAAPHETGPASPPPPQPADAWPHQPPPSQFARERAGARQFVTRAAVARLQSALDAECPGAGRLDATGFDAGCLPKGAFLSFKLPPRILARVSQVVNAAAVAEAGGYLSRLKKDAQRDLCLFLMGPEVAPASELAPAVADLRRRAAGVGGTIFVVPVSTNDWRAHVPADAPALVRAILARLKP
ncbi:MAG: DnaJ domain-containing protein [Vicinamibacterales bacterium]|nr:DnaJ domain-containing protein [Vicinamibacterales bacterium]